MTDISWFKAVVTMTEPANGGGEYGAQIDASLDVSGQNRLVRIESVDGGPIKFEECTQVRFAFFASPPGELKKNYDLMVGSKIYGKLEIVQD